MTIDQLTIRNFRFYDKVLSSSEKLPNVELCVGFLKLPNICDVICLLIRNFVQASMRRCINLHLAYTAYRSSGLGLYATVTIVLKLQPVKRWCSG